MKKLICALFIFTVACSPKLTPHKTPSLVIPDLSGTIVPNTPTPVVVTPTPTDVPTVVIDTYVVQPTDNLTEIARRFGLTVEYIAGINNIADWDMIFPGQVLKLTGSIEIPKPTLATGKQIVVKLSVQRTFVFEDGSMIKMFIVSTGTSQYPTRPGDYKIWIKLDSTTMDGPGYHLPDVRWTMYFDESRGFHAKYWNNIYGRPSSHGCVNMTEEDAKWLYNWAEVGTNVTVIP